MESIREVFEVLWPGPLATIQDLGRFGYQQYGVPVSGAMDGLALRIANRLLDNDECAAGLECTLLGPKLKFLNDTPIAITGGDLAPLLNNHPLPMWEVVQVQKGDILSWRGMRNGCRAYLSVAGGIDIPVVLGSKSTYLRSRIGGLEGRALRTGDVLKSVPGSSEKLEHLIGRKVPKELIPEYKSFEEIRVILGPQADHFPEESIATFLNSEYAITPESDRMGYRLEGPEIKHKGKADIISDGIPLGAVQVPGNCKPIVLMVDRQTTGGYTKIATVITPDISKLGQMKPGDKIRFREVSLAQGHQLLNAFQKMIDQIKFK
ncbi:MAG: biotin-dependent carboxyltransferase [Dehalococcoidia bacterium]|nr:biotin-dependent carboxyltransferase [Dehalococcoidia bacterium]